MAQKKESQSPRGRGRYSTEGDRITLQDLRGLNPLAVGVGIQPVGPATVLAAPGLNPLAVGVGIQHSGRVAVDTSPLSQSPRGRGRYSTPSGLWQNVCRPMAVSIPSRSG